MHLYYIHAYILKFFRKKVMGIHLNILEFNEARPWLCAFSSCGRRRQGWPVFGHLHPLLEIHRVAGGVLVASLVEIWEPGGRNHLSVRGHRRSAASHREPGPWLCDRRYVPPHVLRCFHTTA
jgi:hypothetical protein